MTVKEFEPNGVWGHSAVVVKGEMFIFGGFDNTWTNNFLAFNFGLHFVQISFDIPEKCTWRRINAMQNIPPPRQFHSASQYGDSILIFGGFSNSSAHRDFYSFDTCK